MKAIVTGMCALVFSYAGAYMWKINKKFLQYLFILSLRYLVMLQLIMQVWERIS